MTGQHQDTQENKPGNERGRASSLGTAIRQARERHGLSVRQLAKQVRMHSSYISRLETGVLKYPSPEKLERIASALAMNYDDLYSLAGYTPEGLPSFEPYLRTKYIIKDDDAKRLCDHFRRFCTNRGIDERKRESEVKDPWPEDWRDDPTWPDPNQF